MDQLAGRYCAFDGIEETDEVLVAVLRQTAVEDGTVEDVERGEQGGRTVALVIMGHGAALPRLQGQAWLGAIERLNLAFFTDREHDGMCRRADVEPDDILDLLGEGEVVRALEGADRCGCRR